VLILFSACEKQDSVTSRKEKEGNYEESICHFKSFEATVPEGWIGSGNTTQFFYNESYPATYLLIGEASDPEEDIAKNLELFEGTSFYKNRIQFVYETYDKDKVSGTLINERLEKNLFFSGYFIKDSSAYIFCVSESFDKKNYITELTDDVYSSITFK